MLYVDHIMIYVNLVSIVAKHDTNNILKSSKPQKKCFPIQTDSRMQKAVSIQIRIKTNCNKTEARA